MLHNNYLRSYIKPARRSGLTPQTPQCEYVVKDTSSCYWNYMKALRRVLKSKRVEDPISQMTCYSIGGTVFRVLALVSFPFVQKDELRNAQSIRRHLILRFLRRIRGKPKMHLNLKKENKNNPYWFCALFRTHITLWKTVR